MNHLEWALKYAQLGWAIFPCSPGQKTPATQHGVKDATKNEYLIRDWWGRMPDANIAVACGEPSGIYVVDIDVSDRANGWDSLSKYNLPETVKQLTPRGGAHLFFRTNTPPANKNNFLPGVDIRSTGYYVVLTPSIHPNGGRYEWIQERAPWECELAEYPDCLRPQGKAKSSPPPPLVLPSTHVVDSDVLRRASAYLATCDPAVQGCGGHDKLLRAADFMVRGFALSEAQAFDLLAHEFNPRCDPPWDLDDPRELKDFRRKISEAQKFNSDKPVGWLLDSQEYTEQPCLYTPEAIQKLIAVEEAKLIKPVVERPFVEEEEEEQEDPEERQRELAFLTQPTGLLGELCSWINRTALKPQPLLTLGCSLAFLGALYGRKVRAGRLRTNLYCMGIAGSSWGKDHAPYQIRRLCERAGCSDLLGGDDLASDVAIESRLERHPATLFLWDELGHFLNALKNPGANHTARTVYTLMKLYSSAKSVYKGREYKDGDTQRKLIQPCCCIYGFSSPGRFHEGLSPEELQDGWLSRCLVFYAGSDPVKSRDPQTEEETIPESLVTQVRAWRQRIIEPDGGHTVGTLLNYDVAGQYQAADPIQLVVSVDTEAKQRFIVFDNDCIAYGRDNPELKCLWAKGEENARKIALILAVSDNPDNPIITFAHADFACRLMRFLLRDFSLHAGDITESEIERHKRRLLDVVDQAGQRGCVKRELTRKSRWLNGRGRDALLADLLEAEDLFRKPDGKTTRFWSRRHYILHRKQAECTPNQQ